MLYFQRVLLTLPLYEYIHCVALLYKTPASLFATSRGLKQVLLLPFDPDLTAIGAVYPQHYPEETQLSITGHDGQSGCRCSLRQENV